MKRILRRAAATTVLGLATLALSGCAGTSPVTVEVQDEFSLAAPSAEAEGLWDVEVEEVTITNGADAAVVFKLEDLAYVSDGEKVRVDRANIDGPDGIKSYAYPEVYEAQGLDPSAFGAADEEFTIEPGDTLRLFGVSFTAAEDATDGRFEVTTEDEGTASSESIDFTEYPTQTP